MYEFQDSAFLAFTFLSGGAHMHLLWTYDTPGVYMLHDCQLGTLEFCSWFSLNRDFYVSNETYVR